MSDTLNFVLSKPNEAADRIEALEAALREIADCPYVGRFAVDQVVLIARAALAEGQDK